MIMFHQDESFVLADVSAPLGRAGLHRMDSHKLPPGSDPILLLLGKNGNAKMTLLVWLQFSPLRND